MNTEELRSLQADFEYIRQNSKETYGGLESLRKEFVCLFPPKALHKMTLNQYVEGKRINGKPNLNTFCNFIEHKARNLGSIIGSPTIRFGVYVDVKTQKYVFKKEYKDENEAFKDYKNKILDLIEYGKNMNLEGIKRLNLGSCVKGKILFMYYPNKYINIFGDVHVDHFLKKLTLYEANKNLDIVDKREVLLNWKNQDLVMRKWNMFEYADFLYTEIKGPMKSSRVPKALYGYIGEEYPDVEDVISEFISPSIIPTSLPEKNYEGPGRDADYEGDQKRNKIRGDKGEELVLKAEKTFLESKGRKDLANQIEYTAKTKGGDSAGYDIQSFDEKGNKKYIEVKSTIRNVSRFVPFHFTATQYYKAGKLNNYYVYVVFEINTKHPKIMPVENPLQYEGKGFYLTPKIYDAVLTLKI